MKVLITRQIPRVGIDLLRERLDVDLNASSTPLDPDELRRRAADCDALLCLLTDAIDRQLLADLPHLRIVSNHAVGVDNIDVEAATERGIAVTNTPGVLTEATADFTWALLLGLARRLVEGDRMMRAGDYPGWDPLMLLGTDLVGKTLGIIGPGRIGKAVARRARGWEMTIRYCGRSDHPDWERELGATRLALDDLLAEADVVSLHVPLNEETHHLLDGPRLRKMKPTALLINTARGPVIDEEALVAALRDRAIGGAALDVFEREPDTAPGLVDLDNVLLAPHIASATVDTRNRMAEIAARNIVRFLDGERPVSIVNPEVL